MKIEVAPWIKDYVCNMEDLYTELNLEKINGKPTGEEVKKLNHYKDVLVNILDSKVRTDKQFSWEKSLIPEKIHSGVNTDFIKNVRTQMRKGKKILFKGDPGMGKTTLMKKIVWDWASWIFTTFTIVFFVLLKIVNPGDFIENVITDQNPVLEGLGITPEKLRTILDIFGNRCLLILNGLDEHALGENEDVLKIIRGQKLLDCNVTVSSRPHSTQKIQQYFPIIVRDDGFPRNKAEAFACKLLSDQNKIQDVLNFAPTDFRKDVPIYKCPILLSFMCLLVREDDIDFLSTTIHTGEIYTRTIRCLYKKFAIRKNIEYEDTEFVRAVTKIGKLALETLLSGNPLLRRSQVIKEAGPDAFDYGLLIGHEDFRLIRDETADICVTFPHRTIQEFLGAFYFIMMLNDGESIESLLCSNGREPIFLMNPLFLHFCLYILYSDQEYIILKNRDQFCEWFPCLCKSQMKSFQTVLSDRIIDDIATTYPAIDIKTAVRKNDMLHLTFLKDVLPTFKVFVVESLEQLEQFLPVINPVLLNIATPQFSVSHINVENLAVNMSSDQAETFPRLCQVLDEKSNFHLNMFQSDLLFDPQYVCQCDMIVSLSIVSYGTSTVLDFKHTSQTLCNLTHLFFMNQTISQTMFEALSSAVSKNLSHLSFTNCKGLNGKLALLFKSTWLKLSHLGILGTELNGMDVETLFAGRSRLPNIKGLMLSAYGNISRCRFRSGEPCLPLTSLFLDISHENACIVVDLIRECLIPNLNSLGVFMNEQDLSQSYWSFIKLHLDLCNMKSLHSIILHNYVADPSCSILTEIGKLSPQLQKLDISHFRMKKQRAFYKKFVTRLTPRLQHFKGNLPLSLRHSFPSLNSLILSDCGLNSQDLFSLAQTSVEGRLPQLRYLDISHNLEINVDDIFQASCTWGELLKLNITGIKYEHSKKLSKSMSSVFLHSLQEILISDDEILGYRLQNIQKICLSGNDSLDNVASAVDQGKFPALHSVQSIQE